MSKIQNLLSEVVCHEHDAYDISRSFDDRVVSSRKSVAAQVQIEAMVAALEAEIARLTAALQHAQANDYAGAITADAECGGRGVQGPGA